MYYTQIPALQIFIHKVLTNRQPSYLMHKLILGNSTRLIHVVIPKHTSSFYGRETHYLSRSRVQSRPKVCACINNIQQIIFSNYLWVLGLVKSTLLKNVYPTLTFQHKFYIKVTTVQSLILSYFNTGSIEGYHKGRFQLKGFSLVRALVWLILA